MLAAGIGDGQPCLRSLLGQGGRKARHEAVSIPALMKPHPARRPEHSGRRGPPVGPGDGGQCGQQGIKVAQRNERSEKTS